jgi:two-component system response regulator
MRRQILEVLLVAENPEDAQLIAETLTSYHPAIVVDAVQDGAAALDWLFGTGFRVADGPRTPHLILLDLSLTKVSAAEVLRILRTYFRTRLIPVVVLSSSPDEQKAIESDELGISSFLVKPRDNEEFRQMARQIGAYWMSVKMPLGSEISTNGEDLLTPGEDDAAGPTR